MQQIIEAAWENRELLKDEKTQTTIREVIELLIKVNCVLLSQMATNGK